MALISGRPISFKMDLYNPLYVPRPTVEPELFASLRPPTYDGGFNRRGDGLARMDPKPAAMDPLEERAAAGLGGRGGAMPSGAKAAQRAVGVDGTYFREAAKPN